jgi:hypothetical protein
MKLTLTAAPFLASLSYSATIVPSGKGCLNASAVCSRSGSQFFGWQMQQGSAASGTPVSVYARVRDPHRE